MAGSLGSLVIELTANTARLAGDMGKGVAIVEKGARMMTTAVRLFAGGAVTASLTSLISRAIETGDELSKAAVKAGITGRSMSELAHAAKMSDVELNSLSTALKKMQVNLSEAATGGKAQIETLAALGLELKDIKGLSADQQFELIAERISRLKDPADRARAATEMFGKAGADLLPMFEKGAAGIRAAREEAQRLGKSFSDDQLKKLAETDDAIKRMKGSWEALATTLTASVAPALTTLFDILSGKGGKVGGLTGDMGQADILRDLRRQLKALESNREMESSPEYSRIVDGMIRDLEAKIKRFESGELLVGPGGGSRGPRGRNSLGSGKAPGYVDEEKASLTELAEVTTRNIRTQASVWDEYYDELNERTKTSTERQLQQLASIEAALFELRDAGLISAEQYELRMTEAHDQVYGELEEVQTSAVRLGDFVREKIIGPFDEMPDRALEASVRAYNAFEGFFFDPMRSGIEGLAKELLDSLRQSITQSMTDKLFGSKDSGGFGWGDAITKFGKSLLGFANGGSFQVGGAGGTDSQLVAFRASPNERVTVTKPGQGTNSQVTFSPVTHINGSNLTQAQLAAVMDRNNQTQLARISQMISGGAFA